MYCASAIAAGPLIVIEVVIAPMIDAVEQRLHVVERVDRDAALPDLAARCGESESYPMSVGMSNATESPSDPAPARNDTVHWFVSRCRSPRTGASSIAGRDTCADGYRACTDTRRDTRDRARRRIRHVFGPVERLERQVGDRAVDRARSGIRAPARGREGALPAVLLRLELGARLRAEPGRAIDHLSHAVLVPSISRRDSRFRHGENSSANPPEPLESVPSG